MMNHLVILEHQNLSIWWMQNAAKFWFESKFWKTANPPQQCPSRNHPLETETFQFCWKVKRSDCLSQRQGLTFNGFNKKAKLGIFICHGHPFKVGQRCQSHPYFDKSPALLSNGKWLEMSHEYQVVHHFFHEVDEKMLQYFRLTVCHFLGQAVHKAASGGWRSVALDHKAAGLAWRSRVCYRLSLHYHVPLLISLEQICLWTQDPKLLFNSINETMNIVSLVHSYFGFPFLVTQACSFQGQECMAWSVPLLPTARRRRWKWRGRLFFFFFPLETWFAKCSQPPAQEEASVPELRFVPAEPAHLQEILRCKMLSVSFANEQHVIFHI